MQGNVLTNITNMSAIINGENCECEITDVVAGNSTDRYVTEHFLNRSKQTSNFWKFIICCYAGSLKFTFYFTLYIIH